MKKLLVILSLVLWPLSGAIAQDSRTIAVPGTDAKLALTIQGVTGGTPIQTTAAAGGKTIITDGTDDAEVSAAGELEVSGDGGATLALDATLLIIDTVLDAIELVLDQIQINTKTPQTATEPSVVSIGTSATLILAASANTHGAIIKNMGTAIVFLGKSGVAITTGIPILGGIVNDDAKGDSALAEHGDDIYGIVSSGTVNIRLQVRSD